MADGADIESRFWRELKESPVMMLGLDGIDEGRSQPMIAFFEGERAPLWFYTSRRAALPEHVIAGDGTRAIASFTAKGHDLFASLHGTLAVERDSMIVDRFWDDRIADCYPGGQSDPDLVVLRLDADQARIWLSASSFAAPIRRLFGGRPQNDYVGRVAEVLL